MDCGDHGVVTTQVLELGAAENLGPTGTLGAGLSSLDSSVVVGQACG